MTMRGGLYIYLGDAVVGPYLPSRILEMRRAGMIDDDTQACLEGTESWKPLAHYHITEPISARSIAAALLLFVPLVVGVCLIVFRTVHPHPSPEEIALHKRQAALMKRLDDIGAQADALRKSAEADIKESKRKMRELDAMEDPEHERMRQERVEDMREAIQRANASPTP